MLSVWLGWRYALTRQSGGAANFLVRMAILSLTVGVALLVLVLSVMSGFEHELKNKILNLAPHITVSSPAPLAPDTVKELVEQYSSHKDVISIDPVVDLKILAVNGAKTKPLAIAGIGANSHLNKVLSAYINKGLISQDLNTIVLSEAVADVLGVSVGSHLLVLLADGGLMKRKAKVSAVTVVGLFNTQTELDQALAFVPLATAQHIANSQGAVSSLQIYTRDVMAAPRVANQLYYMTNKQFWVSDWTRTQGNLYHAIQTSRQMIILMLVVIIAVAAMNIVTAMIMVVSNKTREIAMLMAMGLRPSSAMAIVLVQGVLIGVLGIAIGLLAGSVLSFYITDIVVFIERALGYQFLKSDIYPITYLPSVLLLSDVLRLCIPAFLITVLTALYPAWRATKVLPAEALRYDK